MGSEQGLADVDASGGATIRIRCSNGNNFVVQSSLRSTVGSLKSSLVEKSGIPVDQQRLIYKGRVLKDENSLRSYGLENDHTIHVVRGAPSASGATNPSTSLAASANGGQGSLDQDLNGLAGLGGVSLFGFGNMIGSGTTDYGIGLPDIREQLMQNPNLMRDMMSMPAVQSLMSNPDLMRSLIMSNPQLREIIDRNPDLAHILNDPGTLRQTLDAARNPELMREMMRNTDRAMSNIEASPEGFNMLRRMYETVQEPLLTAATMGTDSVSDVGLNPFAALLGTPGVSASQAQVGGVTGTQRGSSNIRAAALPNTSPLPNPWNPRSQSSEGVGSALSPGILGPTMGILDSQRSGVGVTSGGPAGLTSPEVPGVGGGIPFDSQIMDQLLQNSATQQLLQGLLSNSQFVTQIRELQLHLQSLVRSNPQFRDILQNPDFLRQISSPQNLQQVFQLRQAILGQGQQSGRTQGQDGSLGSVNLGASPNTFEGLGSLNPLMRGLEGTTPVSVLSPEQLYASQLIQLQDMGFCDTQDNIRALSATGGNVHAAVERLLGNPG